MSEELKQLRLVRSTALAVLNAVVCDQKLGLFLSEVNVIADYTVKWGALQGSACTRIEGYTNTGQIVFGQVQIVFQTAGERNEKFPVEMVYVSIRKRRLEFDEHFECTFGGESIVITKLDKAPG